MIAVRLERETERALDAYAKRRGRTRSEVVREALRRFLAGDDLAAEARRQSLRVSRARSERATLRFIERVADLEGWK